MKNWDQSTLDFAQHPNYAKALGAHLPKKCQFRDSGPSPCRVGDPRDRLPASEIIGSPVVYQSVVDYALIRAVLTSEMRTQRPFIAASFSEPIFLELRR